MPLARIFTHHPKDAVPVIEMLRAKGYDVEIVPPGADAQNFAELEIRLDRTRLREALKQAAALVSESDADVFLLPGTMSGGAAKAAAPEAVEHAEAEPARWRQAGQNLVESARAWAHRATAAANDIAGLAQVWLAGQRTRRMAAQEEKARQREAARLERDRQIVEAIQRERERAAQRVAERQHLQARAAEVEQARLAAEAQRQQQLERDRIAAEARRQQQAERDHLAAEAARRRASEEAAFTGALHAEAARVEAERLRYARVDTRPVVVPAMRYRRSGRDLLWRKAAFGAVAVTLIFMLGWTVASNREGASPLPAGTMVPQNDVAQEVPFGAATVPANSAANPAASVPTQTGVTLSSGPPASAAKSAAASQRPRRSAADGEVVVRRAEEDVAEPVVIYHRKPKSQANVRAQSDNVKRFSDLQNAEEKDDVKRISDLD